MIDFISEFVSFCLQILFWTIVAELALRVLLRGNTMTQEQEDEIVKKVNEIIHRVKIEQHGDVHYWFDADDDEFLAQGDSIETVTPILQKRFPKHIFFLENNETIYKISGPDWKLHRVNIE